MSLSDRPRGSADEVGAGGSGLFRMTTRRPVAITMVVLAVAVFGYVSYQQLPLNLMPDITYPSLTLRSEFPGAAPEEVEALISRPIEQQLGVVNNLVSITSISRAEQSDVILEFSWDTEMNEAVQTVRENLDRLSPPRNVNRPMILRYDPSQDPIMRLALFGGVDLFKLREISEEELKRELEALRGVAAAQVRGGYEEEIQIEISDRRMAMFDVGLTDINRRLQEENVNLAGGSLVEGQTQYMIRTLNEFRNVAEMEDLVVGAAEGVPIRIRDLGTVRRTHKEREILTRVNGVESVEIDIFKEGDANIVETAHRIRNRLFGTPEQQAYTQKLLAGTLEEMKTEPKNRGEAAWRLIRMKEMTSYLAFSMPEGVSLTLLSDRSTFIQNSVDEVKQTAVVGGLLAVLVLYIFLRNPAHTAIVGLAIPISVIATFAPMNVFGVSLNIMSLGGLALGIGMLVDNSIVVLESIFRCREEGDGVGAAAARGATEVGGAVFASTLTTVAVFFPIAFVEGIAGQIFGDLALTVVFSLLASLGVALFFIPMLASRELPGPGASSALADSMRSQLLQFRSMHLLRSLFRGLQDGTDRSVRNAGKTALVLPWLAAEMLHRVIWIALAASILVLKAACVMVFTVVGLALTAPVYKWVLKRSVSEVWSGFCRVCEDADLFGLKLGRSLWPDLLCFPHPQRLGVDLIAGLARWRGSLARLWRWTRQGSPWKRWIPGGIGIPAGVALAPLAFVYFVVRFLLFHVFWLVGRLFILTTLLASLVVGIALALLALVALPLLAPLLFLFEAGYGAAAAAYPPLLRWALAHRMLVTGGALAAFGICWVLVVPELGRELIPEVRQGEFDVRASMPIGTPLEITDRSARVVENLVRPMKDVARISTSVGAEKTAIGSSGEGEHTATVTVTLSDLPGAGTPLGFMKELWGGIRGRSLLSQQEDDLTERIRARLQDVPRITVEFQRPALFSFKTPIEVEISGYDLPALSDLSARAVVQLSKIPGLFDVRSNVQRGNPEVQVVYDRDRMAMYGLEVRAVASLVRQKVQGDVVTRYREGDRRIDVVVRVEESDRRGVEELERLVVNPGGRVPIRLSSVAQIRVNEGPSEIRRINQQRTAVITANVTGVDLGTMTERIGVVLGELDVPQDVAVDIGGQNREMQTSLNSLVFALGLALFLVYVVMASQFESFVHPFVIMFTIPLALIGVTATLYALSIPLSVVVFLGVIMLAGIVVNNAIVLVDYINHLRRGGMPRLEAIVRAGTVRLRPILMTTSTTVLGLLPMSLGLGEGAEIRTPMAITVVAGLLSSTLLTLVIVPTVYSLLDRGK